MVSPLAGLRTAPQILPETIEMRTVIHLYPRERSLQLQKARESDPRSRSLHQPLGSFRQGVEQDRSQETPSGSLTR